MKSAYAQKYEVSQCAMSHNAACVDDRRTLPVAQRVVQRESGIVQRKGEANGKFKYCESFESHEEGFENGKILFCPYGNVGTECKSRGFTGCLMMAFHFNKVNPITGKVNTEESLNALIFGGNSDAGVGVEEKYVAHVYTSSSLADDTKAALFDAENRGLITIEALFKPCIDDDVMNILNAVNEKKINAEAGATTKFTGGLTLGSDGWSAGVYVPDVSVYEGGVPYNVYNGLKDKYSGGVDEASRKLKSFGSVALNEQTKATKAFVYASVGEYDEMRRELSIKGKINDVLFNLFLKICSIDVLKKIKPKIFGKRNKIKAEIASREPVA